jgi:hypothetical protein
VTTALDRAKSGARARRADPPTSHAAAASLGDLRPAQREVLQLFRRFGPMHDRALVEAARHVGLEQSDSGLRSRRSELVEAGLVRDSGMEVQLTSAYQKPRGSIVWELTPEAEIQ